MTTAVIVQARMGSTRLPGKVLLDLGGRTVLSHVLARCAAIPGADVVVCAVPDMRADDPVATEAERCGVVVTRGPETDVLARYHQAAIAVGADIVMRVTSDCPLIDPEVCGAVLELRCEQGADYAANNMPRSWPHGLDCEAFTAAALARAAEAATEPGAREHVTPWIRANAEMVHANLSCPAGDLSALRWTLDYPEDLDFMRAVVGAVPDTDALKWRDILQVLETHPAFLALNAERIAS